MNISFFAKSRLFQVVTALTLCSISFLLWKLIPHPFVVVIIGLLPIGIIITLRAPLIMVILFVAFSFFRLHEAIEQLMPLKIPLMLSLGAISGLGWGILFTKKIKPWWTKEMTLIMSFFCIVTLGLLFTPNKPEALEFYKGVYWKIILMTFAIAWLVTKATDFKLLTRVMTISGAIIALKTIYNRINEIGLVDGTRVTIGRDFGSILGDPNDLALVLMFPTAFAIAIVLTPDTSKLWRLIALIVISLILPAIIMTGSRGGLLGVLGVLGVFAYRFMKSKILFFAGGAAAAILLFAVAGIDRSDQTAAENGLDASAQGRLHAWEAAIGMAMSNPITGVGVATFYYNYYYYTPVWNGKPHSVHSTWFGVLAETGLVGFAIFASLLISLGKKAYKTLNIVEANIRTFDTDIYISSQAAFAGLIGTAISATFLTHGFSWPFYILGAVIMSGHHVVERIVQNEERA